MDPANKCYLSTTNNCSVNAECMNVATGSGFTCACKPGFTGAAYGGTCTGVAIG